MNLVISSGRGMDWNKYIFGNIINRDDTVYVDSKYDLLDNAIQKVFGRILFSHTLYSKLGYRFSKLFYPSFTLNNAKSLSRIVLFNWDVLSFDKNFHNYVKSRNSRVELVLVLTGTVELSAKYFKKVGMEFNQVLDLFDKVYTFDHEDSKKYSIKYLPLLYSDQDINDIQNKYDLCYVGNAKGRLKFIHDIYEKAVSKGLNCKFYINGVDKNEMIFKDITYNKRITYDESVELSKKSKCILELVQDGQSSSTIRMCEAIVFNKKIITNNKYVKNDYYYDKNFIYVIDEVSLGFIDFIKSENIFDVNPYKKKLLSCNLIDLLENM